MVQVVFFAKPECRGNARQIRVLQASGHDVVVRNLLSEPWSAEELRSYFGDRPVSEWFNRSAVRVKNGEIVPETLTEADAMALLLDDLAGWRNRRTDRAAASQMPGGQHFGRTGRRSLRPLRGQSLPLWRFWRELPHETAELST